MLPDLPQSRRPPVRMDAEDGPWSVSVAESPHDTNSYSLYVKTPTHNLTLTRTAREIVELDSKLREAHPNIQVPKLPLDAASVTNIPTKRKSNFLNTLSRLASPHGSKIRRYNNAANAATPASTVTSPLASPSNEKTDPFQTVTPNSIITTPQPASTFLAAYFTTLSNTSGLRQARVWKRFVRVRTDDLESVRVERAIKRVRSDLAAHTGMSGKERTQSIAFKEAVKEVNIGEAVHEDSPTGVKELGEDSEAELNGAEAVVELPADPDTPKTPVSVGTPPSSRLHRSRSADPDSSARLSRAFTASSIGQDTTSSQTDMETGDESSASHAKKPKKKISMPGDSKKKGRKVVIDDFEMMRVLGKGCAGKVLLVKHRSSSDLYALKAITKRHVLAHQELQHTLTEQSVLKRMAAGARDPFVVKLWWSFHDKENLFLVMDFHPGGDLATQLARWGRLGRDRARFYAAEIVEGVEGLHAAGVIYRDLKPENILIGGDGHIVLTDFGLSKEFPMRAMAATAPATPSDSNSDVSIQPAAPPWMQVDTGGELAAGWPGPAGHVDQTATFCGTAEYLAPEVIQGLPYSYQVDWWSFGTMLYEMLMGITPFWAQSHSDMYVRVLQDEIHFPDDRAIDQDTKSLLRGLLQKNPALRITEPRIKRHPYFSMIEWSHVYYKRYIPPYIPPTDPSNRGDTQNFDDTFLDMEPVLDEYVEEENDQTDTDQDNGEHTDTDRTDGESNTTPSQSRSSSVARTAVSPPTEDNSIDLFDGYSFKGRHSVLIDDEEEQSSEEETDEEEEDVLALRGLEAETLLLVDNPQEVEVGEPKTPEARPATLPPDDVLPPLPESPIMSTPTDLQPDTRKETSAPQLDVARPRKSKDIDGEAKPVNKLVNRLSRAPRREKSGVPALDQYLSDGAVTEHDDEDEDWDFIEAVDGEDRNGSKATSLFARGVVDRYRLAVFRKASTPTSSRTVSATSVQPGPSESPTSSLGQRRGANPGLSFRRNPRQFLKPKSPPSSYSSKASMSQRSMKSNSGQSFSSTSPTLPAPSPSLKSKESATSVGATSDQSDSVVTVPSASEIPKNGIEHGEKKTKKLKKYKENAEKVFSLFSPTPRLASASSSHHQ